MVCNMYNYIDPTTFVPEDSRAMDIYKALERNGIKVYMKTILPFIP